MKKRIFRITLSLLCIMLINMYLNYVQADESFLGGNYQCATPGKNESTMIDYEKGVLSAASGTLEELLKKDTWTDNEIRLLATMVDSSWQNPATDYHDQLCYIYRSGNDVGDEALNYLRNLASDCYANFSEDKGDINLGTGGFYADAAKCKENSDLVGPVYIPYAVSITESYGSYEIDDTDFSMPGFRAIYFNNAIELTWVSSQIWHDPFYWNETYAGGQNEQNVTITHVEPGYWETNTSSIWLNARAIPINKKDDLGNAIAGVEFGYTASIGGSLAGTEKIIARGVETTDENGSLRLGCVWESGFVDTGKVLYIDLVELNVPDGYEKIEGAVRISNYYEGEEEKYGTNGVWGEDVIKITNLTNIDRNLSLNEILKTLNDEELNAKIENKKEELKAIEELVKSEDFKTVAKAWIDDDNIFNGEYKNELGNGEFYFYKFNKNKNLMLYLFDEYNPENIRCGLEKIRVDYDKQILIIEDNNFKNKIEFMISSEVAKIISSIQNTDKGNINSFKNIKNDVEKIYTVTSNDGEVTWAGRIYGPRGMEDGAKVKIDLLSLDQLTIKNIDDSEIFETAEVLEAAKRLINNDIYKKYKLLLRGILRLNNLEKTDEIVEHTINEGIENYLKDYFIPEYLGVGAYIEIFNKKLVGFELIKQDLSSGQALPDVTFQYSGPYRKNADNLLEFIGYNKITTQPEGENGWYKFTTNGTSNVINMVDIDEENEVYAIIQEVDTAPGYNRINEFFAIKYIKDDSGVWKYAGIYETESVEVDGRYFWQLKELTKDYEDENIDSYRSETIKFDKNKLVLTMKNYNGFSFNLNKVDGDDKELTGAMINYVGPYAIGDDNRLTFIDKSDISPGTTESYGWQQYQTDGSKKFIQVSNIDTTAYQNVCVLIEEKSAPEGYKKLQEDLAWEDMFDVIAVIYKYENETWQFAGLKKAIWVNEGEGYFKLVEFDESVGISNGFVDSYYDEKISFNRNTVEFKLKNEPNNSDFSFKIKKENSITGAAMPGVTFKVVYNTKDLEYTTGSDGEVTIPIYANGKENVTVLVHEITPTNYEPLGYAIQLTFEKNGENWELSSAKKWTDSEGITEIKSGDLISTKVSTDGKVIAILKVKNKENPTPPGETPPKVNLMVKKQDYDGNDIDGAKFTVTIDQGGTFEDGSTQKTDFSPEMSTSINPESYDKTIIVRIAETTVPDGYIGLSGQAIIEYTYNEDTGKWDKKITTNPGGVTVSGEKVTVKNRKKDDETDDIITGTVYLDGYEGSKVIKAYDGEYDEDDEETLEGIIVKLKSGSTVKDTVITGSDGKYTFYGIERGKKYAIEFVYDGINYKATTPGPGSQAEELNGDRTNFNKKFTTIEYGKSNGDITLEYEETEKTTIFNWKNEDRSDLHKWKLKTLEDSGKSAKNDFQMTASTTFKMENDERYYYNYTIYSCTHTTVGEGEDAETVCTPTKESGSGWYESTKSDSLSTCSEGSLKGTDYKLQKTNYYIEGGTKYKDNEEYWPYYTEENENEEKRNSPYTYELNFGLVKREVDLSLVNDLYSAEVSINKKVTEYSFAGIPLEDDSSTTFDVGSINSYDEKSYKIELTENDFIYGTTLQKFKEASTISKPTGYSTDVEYDIATEDALKIKAKYRIVLNNQSTSNATVNEIAYYYDPKYELVGIEGGTKKEEGEQDITLVKKGDSSKSTKKYKKIIIEPDAKELEEGSQQVIFVTFNILPGDDGTIQKIEYNTMAEIIKYSTEDGKVDIDSAPGNAVRTDTTVYYEDDTDIAPAFNIVGNNDVRKLSGCVWNDSNKVNSKYSFADGIINEYVFVKDVIVQLIEIREDNIGENKYYIWAQDTTNSFGEYIFKGFIPGNYIVRFVYGSEEDATQYNGQDYKSTTDLNYADYKNGKWYNEYFDKNLNASVARDNEARRLTTIKNTTEITKEKGEALRDKTDVGGFKYTDSTYMFADTSKINIAVASETGKETSNTTDVNGKLGAYHKFDAVNFGLEKRPRNAIKLEKHIKSLKVTASDGTTIVDATVNSSNNTFTGTSVKNGLTVSKANRENRGLWKLEADLEESIAGSTLEILYEYTVTNVGENDYISKTLAEAFKNDKYVETLNGAINEINNKIRTEGYNSILGKYLGSTYYTGNSHATDVAIVKTEASQIEDYIDDKLKFSEVKSTDFELEKDSTKNKEIIVNSSGNLEEKNEVNRKIVRTKNKAGLLEPMQPVTKQITLESNGKLTSTGDLTYISNLAQMVGAYSNAVGRRDECSVPNNLTYISIPKDKTKLSVGRYSNDSLDEWIGYQVGDEGINKRVLNNNFKANIEPDTFWGETVQITKPTGLIEKSEGNNNTKILTIAITIGIAITIAGVYTIKRYVL